VAVRVLILALVLAASVFVGDHILYRLLVVPRLPGWTSVPAGWWLVVLTPGVFAPLLVGSLVRGVREGVAVVRTGAALSSLYLWWAAQAHQPGHLKSYALEGPALFWVQTPLLFFGVFGLGSLFAYLVASWRSPRSAG